MLERVAGRDAPPQGLKLHCAIQNETYQFVVSFTAGFDVPPSIYYPPARDWLETTMGQDGCLYANNIQLKKIRPNEQ